MCLLKYVVPPGTRLKTPGENETVRRPSKTFRCSARVRKREEGPVGSILTKVLVSRVVEIVTDF